MYVSLTTVRTIGKVFIYTSIRVLKSLFVIGLCPMNINIYAPKIWALQMDPREIMAILSKIAATFLIKFQKFVVNVSLNKTI
jgi:hypothetical protein